MSELVTENGVTRFAGKQDDRKADRDRLYLATTTLVASCETDADQASRLIRMIAANPTISVRNSAMLLAGDCPPVPTRYFGGWRNAGYRVIKGRHGYATLTRTDKGFRTAWRFAAVDVESHKGAGPAFKHPGYRPVSRETLATCHEQVGGDELAGLILAAIQGSVEASACTLADLEAARQVVLALRDAGPCLYCGWDGNDDGGCLQCR